MSHICLQARVSTPQHLGSGFLECLSGCCNASCFFAVEQVVGGRQRGQESKRAMQRVFIMFRKHSLFFHHSIFKMGEKIQH